MKCTRAELLAHRDPGRAQADARWALDWAVAHRDEWVRGWSLRASAVAAREASTPLAALKIFDGLLHEQLAPAERVRSLIALGETLLGLDRSKEAVEPLAEAEALGRQIGAKYLTASALVRLREADSRQSVRIGRALKDLVSSDPAYERLLEERHSIEIRVLGDAGVFIDGERVKFETKKSELIVLALALAGPAGLHAEELIDRLWGESPTRHTTRRLNTEIHLARQALATLASRLETRAGIRALRVATSEVDYLRLTATALAALRDRDAGLIEESSRALDEPLLSAWCYEPWAAELDERRKALRARLMKAL